MKRFDTLQNNIVYIEAYWFSNGGIVLAFDTLTKEHKCYIEGGNNIGDSMKRDVLHIAGYGNTLPLQAAKGIFPHLDLEEDYTITNAEYFV